MRVLTNTPSAIGRAASAFASGPRATDQDRQKIRTMFGTIGLVVEVDDDQINAVTALAGSGPAFVYAMIEALARGGEKVGLNKQVSLQLAAQTALGATEMMMTSGKSPEELIKMVVTPGGTTAAGLRVMEERFVAAALADAVEAATKRGQEMARENLSPSRWARHDASQGEAATSKLPASPRSVLRVQTKSQTRERLDVATSRIRWRRGLRLRSLPQQKVSGLPDKPCRRSLGAARATAPELATDRSDSTPVELRSQSDQDARFGIEWRLLPMESPAI